MFCSLLRSFFFKKKIKNCDNDREKHQSEEGKVDNDEDQDKNTIVTTARATLSTKSSMTTRTTTIRKTIRKTLKKTTKMRPGQTKSRRKTRKLRRRTLILASTALITPHRRRREVPIMVIPNPRNHLSIGRLLRRRVEAENLTASTPTGR